MTYILTTLLCIFCPLASYRRFRSLLHPHFIFTMSWVFLLPMGVMLSPTTPGYILDLDADAFAISRDNLLVLGFLFLLFTVTLLTPTISFKATSWVIRRSLHLMRANAQIIGAIGLGILLLEIGKQFYSCGWSPGVWFEYTIGPRFGRPWLGGYIGGDDFIFTLIGNVFFATALLLPLAFAGTKGLLRLAIGCGEIATLFILICNGSRTPVALMLLIIGLIWHFSTQDRTARMIGHVFLISALIAITSVMLYYRSEGFASGRDVEPAEISYSQDDNYYRLIRILHLANESALTNWDATTFLTAAVVNPIPRYFWENKPLLTQEFFGDWKPYFITVSFVGECIAMFGVWKGFAAALIIGMAYYKLLLAGYRMLPRPFGVPVYLTIGFYVYMAERSIQNVGMNAVILVLIMAIYYMFQDRSHRAPALPGNLKPRLPMIGESTS